MKLEHPLIEIVIRNCVFLNCAHSDIIIFWVLSHIDIKGNEKADSAAKSALDLPPVKVGVPYTDSKHYIRQYLFSTWQGNWRLAVHLQAVKLSCVVPPPLGHTHLTHSYILKKDTPHQCEQCQCILTVHHILVECNNLNQTRKSFRFHLGFVLF